MNVTLTKQLDRYVAEKVASGRYADASEVLREAVRQMEEREQRDETVSLQSKITAGLQTPLRSVTAAGWRSNWKRGMALAERLRKRFANLDVLSVHETPWVGLAAPVLLEILDAESRTLVTRDVNSVPLHANRRLEAGRTHGGVIYADSKRLQQTDTRGLTRRLASVVEKHGQEDWTCRSGWL